jgi:hypothetical protein
MNKNQQPATKDDAVALREDITGAENSLARVIREFETKVLTAFYDIARSDEQRISQLESSHALHKSRIGSIEDRLLEVEKRLNMPPAA